MDNFDKLVEELIDSVVKDEEISEEQYNKMAMDFFFNEETIEELNKVISESEEDVNDAFADVIDEEISEDEIEEFANFIDELKEACEANKDSEGNVDKEKVLEALAGSMSSLKFNRKPRSERIKAARYHRRWAKTGAGRRSIRQTARKARAHGGHATRGLALKRRLYTNARIHKLYDESEDVVISFPFDDEERVKKCCEDLGLTCDFDEDFEEFLVSGTLDELEALFSCLEMEESVDKFIVSLDDFDDEDVDDEEEIESDEEEDEEEVEEACSKKPEEKSEEEKEEEEVDLEEEVLNEVKRNKKIARGRFKAAKRRKGKVRKDGQIWDKELNMYRMKTPKEKIEAIKKARKMKIYNKKYKALEACSLPESIVDNIVNAAKLRMEAISENINNKFEGTTLFGSLNESESKEIKGLISEAVQNILEQSYEKIAIDAVSECENVLNEEIMPTIIDIFENDYIKEIVKSLNENVDSYISSVAQDLANDLEGKKLIVKSQKSEQLEEFAEAVLDLIEDKLQIIPEQEDALLSANETIHDLNDQIEESTVERKKLVARLNEAKKEAYIYKNIPSNISEAQKEHLLSYCNDVLSESASFSDFMKGFDKAVSELTEINEDVKEEVKPSDENPQAKYSSDLLRSVLNLG